MLLLLAPAICAQRTSAQSGSTRSFRDASTSATQTRCQYNVRRAANTLIAAESSSGGFDASSHADPPAFSRLSQPRTMAKQLEEAAIGELPVNPTVEDLPKVVCRNRRAGRFASTEGRKRQKELDQTTWPVSF
ncbi:hypothetical protein Purlil1_13572 [Purpureocillium lilacinum]|uniref:Uncharacterized protein n=1 Tax=Purpureocillium lilacinum TaxID=33203 RepID=A0ABR0BDT8_PURLI|nr:hypothetical protein Purlil1_13572 [Purpureocillium lilacinum]